VQRHARSVLFAPPITVALLLALALAAAPPLPSTESAVERYLEDVETLAAPEMEGRGAGTEGIEKAARYLEAAYEEIGLEPAGEEGYRQPFEVTVGASLGDDNSLSVRHLRGVSKYEPGEDYTPINFSASGEASGEVVFAGYGITAEEKGYDDYAEVDVEGKIALILRYEPDFFDEREENAEGEKEGPRRYTRHAGLINKAINARNHGAQAVLLVNGDRPDGGSDRLIKFGSVSGPRDAGILMAQVKNAVAERWLRRSGKSLKLLQRDINLSEEPQSFALSDNLTLSLEIEVERETATVSNIVGYLPGETDEYVIVGAHYDHLGYGDESSLAPDQVGEAHLGADDNASGTAGLLELARRENQREGTLRRGLLVIAFAGEEIGLLGSGHWAANPTRPLEDAVAMINMDMIGRIDKGKVYAGGVATAEMFEPLLDEIDDGYSFEVSYSGSGYSASDHTSFTAKGVPVLFFFSGLHGDYHKPSDTADKINAEAAVELLGMVDRVATELREGDERPEFVKAGPADPHGGHGGPISSGGGGGYGPWFGSIPDFAEVPSGVRFADIRPGAPAGEADLRAGDILVEYDGKPIQNLYDFTYALRESKVGQTVTVKVLRGEEEILAPVTLAERP